MNLTYILSYLFLSVVAVGALSCDKGNGLTDCVDCAAGDRIEADYNPEAYPLDVPDWMPEPAIPDDNPLTVAGVALGRHLFYDPILSSDSTMSCATCHQQALSFSDPQRVSTGVAGREGTRNSMALVNLAYNVDGFFWDGRAASLEEQALSPVENHLELNADWEVVEERMRAHDVYPAMFRRAFGIERKAEINRDLVVKAIAQFERTLISGNARFDRVVHLNDGWLTDAEERGRQLFFFEELQTVDHPGCSHCHFTPLFTSNKFMNNGLDDVEDLEDFADPGQGGVNGNRFDLGKFRVPTLRNIELTAPYMHDGRFRTLSEVLDHYSAGGHGVENENVNIRPFEMSERDKADLIAFLKTLTDTSFVNNPAFTNPFQ